MTNTTESEREAFEAWAREYYGYGYKKEVDFCISSMGFYIASDIENAWQGWQARSERISLSTINELAKTAQEEAKHFQEICDDVLADIEELSPKGQANWTVNWADLSCRDVLVSVLLPDSSPTLKIEEASPNAWGFAIAVSGEMEKRTGIKFNVETEW